MQYLSILPKYNIQFDVTSGYARKGFWVLFHSINKQINVTSGASLGAAVLVMILVGVLLSNSLFSETSDSLRDYSKDIISESLKRIKSDTQAVEVTVSDIVRIAKDAATTQNYLKSAGLMNSLSRDDISNYVKYMVVANPSVLGSYITWEANAIDGNDSSFIDANGHSDQNGQFGPYWTRSASGELGVRPVDFPTAYAGTTPDSRGVRPGDWLLCSRDTREACVSDPAVWDVQGKPTLMTSITAPILQNGSFLGLAGVDLSVAFIQQLVVDINQNIYNGAGQMRVVSYFGSIVADTQDAGKVGEPLDDKLWTEIAVDVKAGRENIKVGEQNIRILLPLKFSHVANPWAVELQLPTEVAMRTANELNNELEGRFNRNLFLQLIAGGLVALVGFMFVFITAKQISSPVRKASQLVTELSESEGDLTKRINIRIDNEVGTLSRGLNSFLGKTHEIIKDTCDSLSQLRQSAKVNADLSHKTQQSVDKQEHDVDEVTSAINEMTRATAEIAQNCTDTAQSAENALTAVKDCADGLDMAVSSLGELTQNMEKASEQVDELEEATQGISGIIEVISDISEQTNLLALNAAIEAARAGEQGRGFAVVADEVRNLATRTNQSTTEINALIETLAKNSGAAVIAMRKGAQMCSDNMQSALDSQQQLNEVVATTQHISDAAITIAASVEEQNVVASEISRNINNINTAIHDVNEIAHQTNDESSRINDVTNQLEIKLNQFKY